MYLSTKINLNRLIKALFLSCFLFLFSFNIKGQDASFNKISREVGLTSNFITSIYEDGFGYMWFGTTDGLNRYDGKNINNYYAAENVNSSLNHNYINNLLFTSKGELLIANLGGLNKFNYRTEEFSKIKLFNATNISILVEDNNNYIWVVSVNGILFKLDLNLKKVPNFSFVKLLKESLDVPTSSLRFFKYDQNNLMIYVLNKGFYLFNFDSHKLSKISNQLIVGNLEIFKVLKVSDSEFWLATTQGVFVYKDGELAHHFSVGNSDKHLNNGFVRDLIKKNSNEIWAFTDGGGINVYNLITKKFKYIKQNLRNEYSISSNFLYCSFTAKDSTLWIGSINKGISHLIANNPFTTYKLRNLKGGVRSDYPTSSLYKDTKNRIWIGSDGNGLYKLTKKNRIEHVFTNDYIKTIPSINEYSSENLLLGTYKKGVCSFNIKSGKFTKQSIINQSIKASSRINVIGKDKDKNLLIGANKTIAIDNSFKNSKGLLMPFDLSSMGVKSINAEHKDFTLFGSFRGLHKYDANGVELILEVQEGVNAIVKFNDNEFWIATGIGIGLINVRTKNVQFYSRKSGLNTNFVRSLIQGSSNELWLGTPLGVSKFDIENKSFTNFTYEDGFEDNEFKNNAVVKSKDGTLYFGGLNGILSFNPKNIKPNIGIDKKVVFTKLLINHANIGDDAKQISDKFIAISDQIKLNHNQKVITINYSNFEFTYPDKIKFLYKLEGFENDWKATTERSLTYMNLDHGTYTLKVKASNTLGEFGSNYSSVKLTVLPAWWQTFWFKLLLLLAITTFILVVNFDILRRQKIKRQFQFEKQILEKQLDLDNSQLRFFTNLSHEIKTPLSLILSPIQEIFKQEGISGKIKAYMALIQKNALRIDRLANRAMDFRKTQFKEPELQAELIDIMPIIKELIDDFSKAASNNNISIRLESDIEEVAVWVDTYYLDSILYNLLSNAVKYSNANGEIKVRVNRDNDNLYIKIQDYGKGIASNDIEHIFERFYQTGDHIGGSGIGLALTKKLVEAHKGTIQVESEIEKGSTFKVTLKLGDAHIADEYKKKSSSAKIIRSKNSFFESSVTFEENISETSNNTILIVEDELDLQMYLKTYLSQYYNIIAVNNGVEALDVISSNSIDLILSDIMMPEMDGFELCNRIKSNPKTSSIPIILLTAKALDSYRKEGYDIGADAFIEKPFQLDVLKARIKNLLESRILLKNKFLNLLDIDIEKDSVNNSDKQFYDKSIRILEKNIQNVDFDVKLFTQEMGMSKSIIYRRMSKITNIGINELMLKVRMNRASQLLIYSNKTIEDISVLVGFKSSKYFSTTFKKHYKKTPSIYRQMNMDVDKRVQPGSISPS